MDSDELPPDLIPLDTAPMPTTQPVPHPSPHDTSIIPAGSVPVTIVTGFLGSGKTTLLKHILNAPHGKRIAVVLNEFGSAMNIERSALQHASISNTFTNQHPEDRPESAFIEGWMELANGCLCCSVKDAGVQALENLLRQRGRFDYILLETTGLADPVPIASMLWVEPALQSQLCLDGVVTVLDVSRVSLHADDATHGVDPWINDEACARQVAMADRILLNKRDLVSSERLQAVTKAVRTMNPSAQVQVTERSQVSMDWLLDIHAYDLNRMPSFPAAPLERRHQVLGSMTAITIALPEFQQLSWKAFEGWLQEVLWEKRLPGSQTDAEEVDVVRCKGMLFGVDGCADKVCIVQGVSALYDREWIPIDHIVSQMEQMSRMVFIGRKLDYHRMRMSLVNALQVKPE